MSATSYPRPYMLTKFPYHLHLILPEFLLPGLVKEWKGTSMVYEDVSQYGELGIGGCDFTQI